MPLDRLIVAKEDVADRPQDVGGGDDDAIEGADLSPGTTVELRITTQYGAVTFYTIDVPPSLSDKTAVSV